MSRAVMSMERVRVAEPDRRVRLAEPALQNAGTDPAQQYAVLLLNEQQMAQLLQRPVMAQVNPRFMPANNAFAGYTRMMRHARIAMVILVILIAGATAWAWAPLPTLSALPWAGNRVAPTIATGASFSLTIPSSRTADGASELAGRLVASGIPAFTSALPASAGRKVMVGPYVSLDEAEKQQRRLARIGYAGARVFVDDSLRGAPKNDVVADVPANPSLVLVGVGDRMSLAIELKSEPRQVNTKRSADGTLMVEIGPVGSDLEAQSWTAPANVDLVRQMTVEEIAVTPDASYLRATLTMPESTAANARVEGRRVYIDLTRSKTALGTRDSEPGPAAGLGTRDSGLETRAAAPVRLPAARKVPMTAAKAPAATAVPTTPAIEAPRAAAAESLQPLVGRFERLVPFLQSAATTASPDVLRALGSTINELDASLRQFVPSAEAADAHGALVSAVAPARRAVDMGFAGDRVAQARQAAMLVEAAKTVMPAMPAK